MYDRGSMGMKKEELKSYTQQMYKVGYGSNLWGIISEDSLDKYDYLEGCIEEYGTRTCLLYTSDAADDLLCVDLGGRRIIKK